MELDEDVLEMVRRQLDREPPPSTAALYGRAGQIDSDIYELSLRQFHAKYPLRVKREQARRERRDDAEADGTRARVRRVFWRLARDVAEAERPEGLVDVVESIPVRVDEIASIVTARPSGA